MKKHLQRIKHTLTGPARFFWMVILIQLAVILVLFLFNLRLFPKALSKLLSLPQDSSINNDVVLDQGNSQNSGSIPTTNQATTANPAATDPELEKRVLPSAGLELPVRWGDLGKRLIESGVIDQAKFENLYSGRGGLNKEMRSLLSGTGNGTLKITADNSGFILNLLWALGLGNKNGILEKGPMSDPKNGGAGNFASTGGWSLAKGKAMDYYSKFPLIALTPEQQQLVERVSKNIYRPCCGNSTYFPDCNHGMAMLALLELMAAQGVGEKEMYKYALQVNAYWFPDTYLTIAKYLQTKGKSWETADPQELLGASYSSGQGYQKITQEVQPVQPSGGGGGSC